MPPRGTVQKPDANRSERPAGRALADVVTAATVIAVVASAAQDHLECTRRPRRGTLRTVTMTVVVAGAAQRAEAGTSAIAGEEVGAARWQTAPLSQRAAPPWPPTVARARRLQAGACKERVVVLRAIEPRPGRGRPGGIMARQGPPAPSPGPARDPGDLTTSVTPFFSG